MLRPLVVLGSINADLFVDVPRLPLPGETLGGGNARWLPGGKGANQAAAAARLGHPTRFIGQVGDDAHAPMLRTALASAGVDVELLCRCNGASGQALILLQTGGENSIILIGGANQDWRGLPAPAAAAIAGAGALLLQREVPAIINLAAARLAHSAAVPVLLDAGGAGGPLDPELLPLLTLVSPNETELDALLGGATGDPGTRAQELLRRGARTVLVKLGADGCLLAEPGRPLLRQAAFRVQVTDTTGAGDCCTAAYAVALLEGMPAPQRLRFACAAAAICVQRPGAMPSMPTRAEVEALLARG